MDLINRADAIDAIIKLKHKPEFNSANSIRDCYVLTEAQEAIKHLPSAERKRGEWEFSRRDENVYDIRGNKSWANWYRCSNCKFSTEFIENHNAQYRYCPQCGVCMRGDDD